jgi:hypothetical protein
MFLSIPMTPERSLQRLEPMVSRSAATAVRVAGSILIFQRFLAPRHDCSAGGAAEGTTSTGGDETVAPDAGLSRRKTGVVGRIVQDFADLVHGRIEVVFYLNEGVP